MNLVTEHLTIRQLNWQDKARLFDIYSDKDAMKYRGSKPFEHLDEVDAMLNSTFQKMASQEEFRYAVEHTNDSTLIGTFLIKPITEQVCEIGYSIAREYWGFGYGKELVIGMMPYLKQLQFQTITATSKKENLASLKLLESVGFKLVPDKELNDCYVFEYVD